MLALRSAPPIIGVAEAERVVLELYGLAVTVRHLSGERDANFQASTAGGTSYVFKILRGPPELPATDCQVAVLRHLVEQDASLPVPKIYPTQRGADLGSFERDDGTYTSCLFNFLPGELLAHAMSGNALHAESRLRRVGASLARVDRALRGFFHPALAQRIAWDVRRLPELMELASCIESDEVRRDVEDTAAAFERLLPTLRGLRHQAIHGDCHASNLLVDPAGEVSGILDFGDLIHAPLILEPAVAMADLLIDGLASVESVGAVLAGYAAGKRLWVSDIEVLFELIAARHAVSILIHSWRGHDDGGADPAEKHLPRAAPSLQRLRNVDRAALLREWQAVAARGRQRSAAPADSAVDLERRHRLMGTGAELFYEQPLHLVRGEGVWLFDAADRAYLDAYNNVPHVGHTQPDVVRAIQEQTATLQTHTRYLHGGILDYAEQLMARCPPHLDSRSHGACIFVNSGSEANDVAWRLARFATGQRGALVMAHAYHGITDAVAPLTLAAGVPLDPHVASIAPPPSHLNVGDTMTAEELQRTRDDAERAIRALDSNGFAPAAFYLDSGVTSSGIFDPPPAWLAVVAERVRAAGGLMIADEVQYGLGRSGSHFWGFERRGLKPDIITLGKPVGNGYPMGVVIANRGLIEAFQAKYGFFSTFGGGPVAAAAGRAVLEVIDREHLLDNARDTGAYLRARLQALAVSHDCFGSVRGSGLLVGLDVLAAESGLARRRTKAIVNRLAAHSRILIGSEGPDGAVLKIRPPMPFQPNHADLLVQALDEAAVQTAGLRG